MAADSRSIESKDPDPIPEEEFYEWLVKPRMLPDPVPVVPGSSIQDLRGYFEEDRCIVAVQGPDGKMKICGGYTPSIIKCQEHLVNAHQLVLNKSTAKPSRSSTTSSEAKPGDKQVICLDDDAEEEEPPKKRVYTGREGVITPYHAKRVMDALLFDWSHEASLDVVTPNISHNLNLRIRKVKPVPSQNPQNALEFFYKDELGID